MYQKLNLFSQVFLNILGLVFDQLNKNISNKQTIELRSTMFASSLPYTLDSIPNTVTACLLYKHITTKQSKAQELPVKVYNSGR